ncbi:uncharacterized protein N7484_005943 [Penicillium longicatenatum]|uniref:uncharacterized protein n=1 Tax=Penicillium longicatenatum TaxID=1561947 RepID=UPI0025496B40|nr:uncharacterized protein N7484_005943 [Penicillium longicatenatum]KAJ5643436.1 hypothetical protein N7484_005943 [Penicillium longicatenatum]KAJ5645167.1 hypothetical protein N7507_011178 [Penicillium longicatenatum]
MVRLKNRYLLIDILYPDPATWPSSTPKSTSTSTSAQLAIHSPTSDALTPGLLAKMIREEVSELYGDCGVGKLGGASAGGINVKYLSPATSTAILRCPRASFRLVWSALTHMSHVPSTGGDASQKRPNGGRERGCVFRVLRVSGTMKKAEEEAIRRARREIVRVRGVEEKGVLGDLVSGAGAGKNMVMQSVVDVSDDEMEDE